MFRNYKKYFIALLVATLYLSSIIFTIIHTNTIFKNSENKISNYIETRDNKLEYLTFDENTWNSQSNNDYNPSQPSNNAVYAFNIEREKIDYSKPNAQIQYNVGNYIDQADSNSENIINIKEVGGDYIFATSGRDTLDNNFIYNDIDKQDPYLGVGEINVGNENNIFSFKRSDIINDSKFELIKKEGTTLKFRFTPEIYYRNNSNKEITNNFIELSIDIPKEYFTNNDSISKTFYVGNEPNIKLDNNIEHINPIILIYDSIEQFKIVVQPFYIKLTIDRDVISFSLVNDVNEPTQNDSLKYLVEDLREDKGNDEKKFNPSNWRFNIAIDQASFNSKLNFPIADIPNLVKIGSATDLNNDGIIDENSQVADKLYGIKSKKYNTNISELDDKNDKTVELFAPFEIKFKPFVNEIFEPRQALFVKENGGEWIQVPSDASTGVQTYKSYKSYMDAILNKQTGDITYEIQVRQIDNGETKSNDNYVKVVYYRKFKMNINTAQMNFTSYGWDNIPQEYKDKYLQPEIEVEENGKIVKKPNPYYRDFLDPKTGMYKPEIAWVNTRHPENKFPLDPYNKKGEKIKTDDKYDIGYLAQINAPAFTTVDTPNGQMEAGSIQQITEVSYKDTLLNFENKYTINQDTHLTLNQFNKNIRSIKDMVREEDTQLFLILQYLNSIIGNKNEFWLRFENLSDNSIIKLKEIKNNQNNNSISIFLTLQNYYEKGQYINAKKEIEIIVDGFDTNNYSDTYFNIQYRYNIISNLNNKQTNISITDLYNKIKDIRDINLLKNELKKYVLLFNPEIGNKVDKSDFIINSIYENNNQIIIEWIVEKYREDGIVKNNKNGQFIICLSSYEFIDEKYIYFSNQPFIFNNDNQKNLIEKVEISTQQISTNNTLIKKIDPILIPHNNQVISSPKVDGVTTNTLIYQYHVKVKDKGDGSDAIKKTTSNKNDIKTIYQYLKIDNSKNQQNWKDFIDIDNKNPKDIFSWYNFNSYDHDNEQNIYISKKEVPLFVNFWSTYQAKHLAFFLTQHNYINKDSEELLKTIDFSQLLRYWEIYVNAALNEELNFPQLYDISNIVSDVIATNYEKIEQKATMMNEIILYVTNNINKTLNLKNENDQVVYGKDFVIDNLEIICEQLINNYYSSKNETATNLKVRSLLSSNKIIGETYFQVFNTPGSKNVFNLDYLNVSTYTMNSSFPTFNEIFPEAIDNVDRIKKIMLKRVESVLNTYSKNNNKYYLTKNDYYLEFYYYDSDNNHIKFNNINEAAWYLEWSTPPPNKIPSDEFYNEVECVIIANKPVNNKLPRAIGSSTITFINNSQFNGALEQDPSLNPDDGTLDPNNPNNPNNPDNGGGDNDNTASAANWISEHPWIFIVIILGILAILFSVWIIRIRIKSKKG